MCRYSTGLPDSRATWRLQSLTYEALLDLLDMDAVVEAIHSVDLKQPDYEDAATMVLKALKKWGPTDHDNLAIEAVEERSALELPATGGYRSHINISSETATLLGPRSIKMFVDLVGVRRGLNGSSVREVVDWKTTGSISSDQQARLRYSWQGKLYGTTYGCQKIAFRSIQRDGRCVELRLNWPGAAYDDHATIEHYRQALAMRELMANEGRWLQHMPYACKAFGRDCEYRDLCCVHNQAPVKLIEIRPFSYSGAEKFLLCPERYRLDTVLDGDKGSEETSLGLAFHAGVREAWEQIRKLQGQ